MDRSNACQIQNISIQFVFLIIKFGGIIYDWDYTMQKEVDSIELCPLRYVQLSLNVNVKKVRPFH